MVINNLHFLPPCLYSKLLPQSLAGSSQHLARLSVYVHYLQIKAQHNLRLSSCVTSVTPRGQSPTLTSCLHTPQITNSLWLGSHIMGLAVKHLTVPCKTNFKQGALAPEQMHLSICAAELRACSAAKQSNVSAGLHFQLEKPTGAGQNHSLAQAVMKGKSISTAGWFGVRLTCATAADETCELTKWT